MEKNRIEMFSDGIFAIVITLLVLDIKLPLNHQINSDLELRQQLVEILPNIIAYILSFCIVGIFWSAHNIMFHLIKVIDKFLLWLNILYLMIVAFIPFPTSLLAANYDKQSAVILYCFTLGLAGLFHFIILTYLYKHKKLSSHIYTKELRKRVLFPSVFSPLAYLSAILLSIIAIKLSLIILVIVPIYYICFNNNIQEPHRK